MAKESFLVVSDVSMVETEVKKSRFIAVTFPVTTIEQVKDAIGTLRKSNKGAKHIAYAYLLGDDFSIARSNDDGEPAGSAGAPIYQAIREKRITNTLVAVVRYFGGIELGKSRLTRTYYLAALNALNNARKNKMVYCDIYDMKCSFADYGVLGQSLTSYGFPIIRKNTEESMPTIKCAIPVGTDSKIIENIRVKLKESAQIIKVDSYYYKFPVAD